MLAWGAPKDAVGVGVFVFCIVFPMVDAALLGREQNHWMPHKGRSIHIQWLDHRIERNTKKTREVLALDDGQAGDRMYLVHAPKVMKKTRLKFVISRGNCIFCARKCQ